MAVRDFTDFVATLEAEFGPDRETRLFIIRVHDNLMAVEYPNEARIEACTRVGGLAMARGLNSVEVGRQEPRRRA